ncbi:MAG: GxxExxY protein [Candidatus Taylorbacteria bacterium]|nr:GxxExxY protein [Candidatus Taylorbacteria bacterium]
MNANDTNKIIYPELSYRITGFLFKVHNELGRYCRERQYAEYFETLLKENAIAYKREEALPIAQIENKFTNIVDFAINNQLLLDFKAKPVVSREDYEQMLRYLEDASKYRLGIIVNFRNKYLRPIRVIRADS